jgi:hypothetical protein
MVSLGSSFGAISSESTPGLKGGNDRRLSSLVVIRSKSSGNNDWASICGNCRLRASGCRRSQEAKAPRTEYHITPLVDGQALEFSDHCEEKCEPHATGAY